MSDEEPDETVSALRKALERKSAAEGGTKPLVLLPDWRIERDAQTPAQHPRPDPSAATAAQRSDLTAPQVGNRETGLAQPDHTVVEEVIDEAMLQEIVAQMVRQELQGAMGEKITHNIRKLVRAELARELQIRKLDGQSSKG